MKRHAFLLLLLWGCASTIRSGATEPIVTERLYFGRNISNTLGVTDSLWTVFVREVVSSRLLGGFTFWPAEGEWRAPHGQFSHEPCLVRENIHPTSSDVTGSVLVATTHEHTRRFRPHSV